MGAVTIGEVLLHRYRVDAFVAAGGMSAVYKVYDLQRNVYLAMKVLNADLSEDDAAFKSFQREANALRKLAHPNIVPFYGVEQVDDLIFLLEAFIDGPSLKDVIRRAKGQPLPIADALTFLKALCAALGYAHNLGVVHCDVKPGNVMIDRGGNIYLTDFGIARHAESTTTTLAGAGTAAYMAPEQVKKGAVTAETDVYALGIILFEMLTGQRPFRGTEGEAEGSASTSERVRIAQVTQPPPDPRSLNPRIPPALAQVVLKALDKAPARRFASTQALLSAALSAAQLTPVGIPDRFAPPAELLPRTPVPVGGQVVAPSPAAKRSTPTRLVVIATAAVVVVVFLLVRMTSGPYQPTPVVPDGSGVVTFRSQTPQVDTPPGKFATVVSPAAVTPTATLPSVQPPDPDTATPQPPSPKPSPTDTMPPPAPPSSADRIGIPAGEFLMGATDQDAKIESKLDDEQPAHTVYLDAYSIDRTEVTNKDFAQFVQQTNYQTVAERNSKASRVYTGTSVFSNRAGAYWRDPDGTGQGITGMDDYPVVQIAFQDAKAFCAWRGGRLPSEAEWEKAARGTEGRVYPWGNDYNGNFLNGSDLNLNQDSQLFIYNDGFKFAAPVGSYVSGKSPYGVMDMAGNVLEWVNDVYDKNYYKNSPDRNPPGPASGNIHVLRGGSWFSGPKNNRIAQRVYPGEVEISSQNYGFRCAYDQ